MEEDSTNTASIERSLGNTTQAPQIKYISIESTTIAGVQEDETKMDDLTTTSSMTTTKRPKHKTKKTKTKKQKRVNREILSTLLSRKKFYRMLEHKLNV